MCIGVKQVERGAWRIKEVEIDTESTENTRKR